jgi:hypothetical protein
VREPKGSGFQARQILALIAKLPVEQKDQTAMAFGPCAGLLSPRALTTFWNSNGAKNTDRGALIQTHTFRVVLAQPTSRFEVKQYSAAGFAVPQHGHIVLGLKS